MKSRIVVTFAAVLLFLSGAALLFAPAETAGGLVPESAPLIAQLLASSLLGLAAANWIGRFSALGGIYGRSLVVGNLATFGVGGLVTFRAYLDDATVPLLIVTVVALTLAGFFAAMMLRRGTPT